MKRLFQTIGLLLAIASSAFAFTGTGDFPVVNTQNLNVFGVAQVITGGSVVVTLSLTNAPTALTNGVFYLNGYSFAWTNTSTIQSNNQVSITNSSPQAATNLFLAILSSGWTNDPANRLSVVISGTSNLVFTALNNGRLTASNSAPWGSLSFSTNYPSTNSLSGGSGGSGSVSNIVQSGGIIHVANATGPTVTITITASDITTNTTNFFLGYLGQFFPRIGTNTTVSMSVTGASVADALSTLGYQSISNNIYLASLNTNGASALGQMPTWTTNGSGSTQTVWTTPPTALVSSNIGGGATIFQASITGTNQFKSVISSDPTRVTVTGNGSNLVINPSVNLLKYGDSGQYLVDLLLGGLNFNNAGQSSIGMRDSTVNNGMTITTGDNGSALVGFNSGTSLDFSNFTSGVTIGGSKILTAAFQTNNNVVYATDYMKFDGSDDTTNLIRMLGLWNSNVLIMFPAQKTATLSTNWSALSAVVSYYPTNVEWAGNGCHLSVTGTNSQGASAFYAVQNISGFWTHDITFSLPVIATNNTPGNAAQRGSMFGISGATNQNWRMDRNNFYGGEFGVLQNNTPCNYDFTFTDVNGYTNGNWNANDGNLFALSGSRVTYLRCKVFYSGNFGFEIHNPTGGQQDTGPILIQDCYVKNNSAVAIADTHDPSNTNTTLLTVKNLTIECTSGTGGGTPYHGGGISYSHVWNMVIDGVNVITNSGGYWNSALISVLASNSLTVANVRGTSSEADSITAPLFTLTDCSLGTYTINAGSTGSVVRVTGTVANSGVMVYRQDTSGNVVIQGSNSVAGRFTALAGLQYNSCWITNSGSLNFSNAGLTNKNFIMDSSYSVGSLLSNIVRTGASAPVDGLEWTVTKTNSGGLSTIDFGTSLTTFGRYINLVNAGDTVTISKDQGRYNQISGNVWSNFTVVNLFTSGTRPYITNAITSLNASYTMPSTNGFGCFSVTISPAAATSIQVDLMEWNGNQTNWISELAAPLGLAITATLSGPLSAGYNVMITNTTAIGAGSVTVNPSPTGHPNRITFSP